MIRIIEGGVFHDFRGQISHVNTFDMTDIARFYVIRQEASSIVRAWHAHQTEKKYFYVLKGSFTLAFVKIDNWNNPSKELVAEIFQLSDKSSEVLCVPEGYANGLKANEPDSILMVYSNKILADAVNDSWRYDKDLWVDWSQYK